MSAGLQANICPNLLNAGLIDLIGVLKANTTLILETHDPAFSTDVQTADLHTLPETQPFPHSIHTPPTFTGTFRANTTNAGSDKNDGRLWLKKW